MRIAALLVPSLLSFSLAGCTLLPGDDGDSTSSKVEACTGASAFRFAHGTEGHADPLGAAAAKQARAGKITRPQDIAQPTDARHKVRTGDFVLANDKIAVYIEAEGSSDGYFPYGGEILGIESIGPDNRPTGVSHYGEGALMFGLQTISPERVSVLADGSDGTAAIVRVSGTMKLIPLLEPFLAIFPDQYNFPVALDYILEPGKEKMTMRVSVANTRGEAVDFTDKQHLGFFQLSRSKTFTENAGFEPPSGVIPNVAWETQSPDGKGTGFMVKSPLGHFEVFLELAGLQVFKSPSLSLKACEKKTVDYLEVTPGGPGIDGLLEAKRRAYGEPAAREIKGVVREAGGGPMANAFVHATGPNGYLTRTKTDAHGAYALHVPPGVPVSLTPTLLGWNLPAAAPVPDGAATADLTLPKHATIEVNAIDADTKRPLPVRVQIVPEAGFQRAPKSFGIKEEHDDRLHRDYAVNGHSTLPVPAGSHRVIVTRGYEYEAFNEVVVANSGQTSKVNVELKHSVESKGVMCADFHIHSIYSADSADSLDRKVSAAVADGLEIPVSSEHEYVIDFQPVVRKLGLTEWAFGMGSEELTTFSYGHFGVFPLKESPASPNNGAVDWTWKKPPELFPRIADRPEHPMLIVNHPRGDGGYFELAGLDHSTGVGTKELWSDHFGAIEVFNDSDFDTNRNGTVADWFAFLNLNKFRPGVGSSDSHELSKAPIGYPRTCMHFGHDDPRQLTPEKVRDTLRAGTAVVSGGITMTVMGPNGILPGGSSTAGAYKVTVATPSWVEATNLEVIVDGVTTQMIDLPTTTHSHELTINVAPQSSRAHHWVVFHAKGPGDLAPLHPGRHPFAVSNPIFF